MEWMMAQTVRQKQSSSHGAKRLLLQGQEWAELGSLGLQETGPDLLKICLQKLWILC
jgi:hypothetical protein